MLGIYSWQVRLQPENRRPLSHCVVHKVYQVLCNLVERKSGENLLTDNSIVKEQNGPMPSKTLQRLKFHNMSELWATALRGYANRQDCLLDWQ